MNLLLSNPHAWRGPERLFSLLAALWVAVSFMLSPNTGFPASPFEDAACNDFRIQLESKFLRLSKREKNFFLFDASDLGCVGEVRRLLESGAAINARDRAGNTPFLLAARKGHNKVIELLAEAGADVFQTNLTGSNALLMAVNSNRRKTATLLLELGLDPNDANKHKHTALIGAVFNGNKRLVKALLQAGAKPDFVDSTGKGAIVYAAGKGFFQLVELLLSHDLNVNQIYGHKLTAIMWAAGYSNDVPDQDGLKTIATLINSGANLNMTDDRGKTALHIAAARGHLEAVKLLLVHGSDPTIKDKDGQKPVNVATTQEIVRLLKDTD